MAGSDSRIYADSDLSALVEGAVKLQLGKGVAACHNSVVNRKLHFFFAHVVRNKENALLWKARL